MHCRLPTFLFASAALHAAAFAILIHAASSPPSVSLPDGPASLSALTICSESDAPPATPDSQLAAPETPPTPPEPMPSLRSTYDQSQFALERAQDALSESHSSLAAETWSDLLVPTPSSPAAAPPSSAPRTPGVSKAPAALATNRAPVYPEESRRRRQSGSVMIHAVIEASGEVSTATVERSSGHPLLDASALDAVRSWRFAPAQDSGNPTRAEATVPVHFVLKP